MEGLNVGTVPTFKLHNVGTVPTFKMHNVGTVPTYKMHNVGTVSTFKMHNIGTQFFQYFFSLNFSHFIFLYFIKTVGLAHEYYNTLIKFFRLGVVGRHARVKSGSRCWGSPGLLMFVTSTSANTRWVFCFKIPAVEGKMVSVQMCPPLDSRSATQFGSGSSLSWLFSTLGGISTAYLPRREILV